VARVGAMPALMWRAERRPPPPVWSLSGFEDNKVMNSLPEGSVAGAAKGMYSAFLRKPFKLADVVAVVGEVLGRREAGRIRDTTFRRARCRT
jgi:hypothetical protein